MTNKEQNGSLRRRGSSTVRALVLRMFTYHVTDTPTSVTFSEDGVSSHFVTTTIHQEYRQVCVWPLLHADAAQMTLKRSAQRWRISRPVKPNIFITHQYYIADSWLVQSTWYLLLGLRSECRRIWIRCFVHRLIRVTKRCIVQLTTAFV